MNNDSSWPEGYFTLARRHNSAPAGTNTKRSSDSWIVGHWEHLVYFSFGVYKSIKSIKSGVWEGFVSNGSLTSHWKSDNWFSRLRVLYSSADSSCVRKIFFQLRMSLMIGGKARYVLMICWNNTAIHWLEWFWKSWPIRRGDIPNNF